MGIIEAQNLSFDYIIRNRDGEVEGVTRAVDSVDLSVKRGEFISILGKNGSGKSTLAKHINALLFPTEGTLFVDGYDVNDENSIYDIRQSAGLVFQNPENQIIGTLVEEDVGFGPENMGVETKEIWNRVYDSLKSVGMYEYRKSAPSKLSGGQKQRVAIAGILAMKPKCIILDEPTAMLDPSGRSEVIDALLHLNRDEGITIILITHNMEETVYSDRVFVMDEGAIKMQGTPKEIFSHVEELRSMKLDVPKVTALAYELKKAGMPIADGIILKSELEDALCRLL